MKPEPKGTPSVLDFNPRHALYKGHQNSNLHAAPTSPAIADLYIQVRAVKIATGRIMVALYNHEASFQKTMLTGSTQPAEIGEMSFTFRDLPTGKYGVMVFHDINNEGSISTNTLGLPTNPWGSSAQKKAEFRAPTWKECHFYLPLGGLSLPIIIS